MLLPFGLIGGFNRFLNLLLPVLLRVNPIPPHLLIISDLLPSLSQGHCREHSRLQLLDLALKILIPEYPTFTGRYGVQTQPTMGANI